MQYSSYLIILYLIFGIILVWYLVKHQIRLKNIKFGSFGDVELAINVEKKQNIIINQYRNQQKWAATLFIISIIFELCLVLYLFLYYSFLSNENIDVFLNGLGVVSGITFTGSSAHFYNSANKMILELVNKNKIEI